MTELPRKTPVASTLKQRGEILKLHDEKVPYCCVFNWILSNWLGIDLVHLSFTDDKETDCRKVQSFTSTCIQYCEETNSNWGWSRTRHESKAKTRDRDARKALKILQRFVGSNLFGTAPTDALMKLETCLTDAKIRLGPGLNGLPE